MPLELTEWAAIFVAACTAGALIYNGIRQRKHDRLSVRPAVAFVSTRPDVNDKAIITLENHGLGPALISTVHLSVAGQEIPTTESAWRQVLMGKFGPIQNFRATFTAPDEPLRVGSSIHLIELDPVGETKTFASILEAWAELKIEVTYCSLYGEEFKCGWTGDSPITRAHAKNLRVLSEQLEETPTSQ